jgi:hypothetical protein
MIQEQSAHPTLTELHPKQIAFAGFKFPLFLQCKIYKFLNQPHLPWSLLTQTKIRRHEYWLITDVSGEMVGQEKSLF